MQLRCFLLHPSSSLCARYRIVNKQQRKRKLGENVVCTLIKILVALTYERNREEEERYTLFGQQR